MTLLELINNKIMYVDDDFVIFDNDNNMLYDNRKMISPALADYTNREITRIRYDAQKNLVIKVR